MLAPLRAAVRRTIARSHDRWPRLLSRLRGRVLILAYHRVLPEPERRRQCVQPGLYVTPHTFEAHVRFLHRHFAVIPVAELLRRHGAGDWDAEQRYCVITFDDGWLDNYVYAFPILRRYQVPATIFVPTALIGSQEWLWSDKLGWLLTRAALGGGGAERALGAQAGLVARLRRARRAAQIDVAIEACKALSDDRITDMLAELAAGVGVELPKERRFLDWREIEEMSEGGMTFGSHGVTHRILTQLSPVDVHAEVTQSFDSLRRRRISWVPVFSYPNGDCSDAIVQAVRSAGYQAAVSTVPGADACEAADLFRLKRLGVHEDVSADLPLWALHLRRVGRL